MKKRLKIIIPVIGLALIIGLIIFTKSRPDLVQVEDVETQDIEIKRTVSASGTVTSNKEAELSFSTVGKVENIYVDKGEKVSTGQLIARISNEDTYQAIQAAKKTKEAAKKDLEIYVENYSTNISAVGGEDEYYLNVEKLRELVDKADANYQSAIATHSKSIIYAPFPGTIVDINKEESEVVGVGETIVKVADLENLIFKITVDQEDYGYMKLDQPVEVTLDAYEDIAFTGKVTDLSGYADETTGDFEVEISLDEYSSENVVLGLQGDADIIVKKTETPVAVLPFDAVFSTNGDNYIWYDDNGILRKKNIEIGLEGNVYTQIKTDISDKKIVVPLNTDGLEEGMRIKR